ncbi:MAG: hypothetical protein ACRDZW_11540 [Acidimicrobiales bacterium]
MPEPIEHSIWDGAGNEIKVVTGENSEGQVQQGTGPTTEEAKANLADPDVPIGEGFGPNPDHRYSDEETHG